MCLTNNPNPKDYQFIITDEENQKIFPFETVQPVSFWHFRLKNDLNNWLSTFSMYCYEAKCSAHEFVSFKGGKRCLEVGFWVLVGAQTRAAGSEQQPWLMLSRPSWSFLPPPSIHPSSPTDSLTLSQINEDVTDSEAPECELVKFPSKVSSNFNRISRKWSKENENEFFFSIHYCWLMETKSWWS